MAGPGAACGTGAGEGGGRRFRGPEARRWTAARRGDNFALAAARRCARRCLIQKAEHIPGRKPRRHGGMAPSIEGGLTCWIGAWLVRSCWRRRLVPRWGAPGRSTTPNIRTSRASGGRSAGRCGWIPTSRGGRGSRPRSSASISRSSRPTWWTRRPAGRAPRRPSPASRPACRGSPTAMARWSWWSRRRPRTSWSSTSTTTAASSPMGATGRRSSSRARHPIGKWVDSTGSGRFDVLEAETRGFKGPRAFDSSGIPLHHDNQTIVKERIYLDAADRDVFHDEVTGARPCPDPPLDGEQEIPARDRGAVLIGARSAAPRTTTTSRSARRPT